MNTVFSAVAVLIFSFASIIAATLDLEYSVAPAAATVIAAVATPLHAGVHDVEAPADRDFPLPIPGRCDI